MEMLFYQNLARRGNSYTTIPYQKCLILFKKYCKNGCASPKSWFSRPAYEIFKGKDGCTGAVQATLLCKCSAQALSLVYRPPFPIHWKVLRVPSCIGSSGNTVSKLGSALLGRPSLYSNLKLQLQKQW